MKFEWDAKERIYVAISEPEKKDLMALGTRYEHYIELKELWAEGIEALAHLNKHLVTKGDTIKKDMLVAAVALVDKQLDLLSNHDLKKFRLKSEVDAIKPNQPMGMPGE